MEGDFRVGGWLVQPHLDAIVSPDGRILHLEPRVMEVLEFLAARPGEVLSKDAIIHSVWRDTFVTDDALGRCIAELRRVFGDRAEEPHFIRTIPKRGYCLLAPVSALRPSTDRYQIVETLGRTAHAEVALAHDLELRRKVVLKFLDPESTGDESSRKRLLHEARAAAALDHPFICKIYDTGTLHGRTFLAMEHVEGTTLKQRLASGPMPVEEALRTACGIAEALEAAHTRGIVHCDIKPSNIMLTPEGHPKVLDFGVARRIFPAGSGEQDITSSVAKELRSEGTMPYMSPEQLRGQAVQTTSDIFSFGLVLYEMLTGIHPFHRESPIDTVSGILNDEPPPIAVVDAAVPGLLQHVVGKMLAKDAGRRYQVVRDVRTDLQELLDEIQSPHRAESPPRVRSEKTEPVSAPRARLRPAWIRASLLVALVAATGAVTAFLVLYLRRTAESPLEPVRAVIPVSPAIRLAGWDTGIEKVMAGARPTRTAISFSPDGRQLVYSGHDGDGTRLYLRPMSADRARPIPGTEGGVAPFFAPDGRKIGFWAGGMMKVVELFSGRVTEVCRHPDPEGLICGADWLSNDDIVFALLRGGIWKVPAAGGRPVAITQPDEPQGRASHRLPHVLPGGRALLYTSMACADNCEPQIVVQSLDTGRRRTLVRNGSDARFVPGGFLVFARGGTLLAARFDPASQTLREPAVPVLAGVEHAEGSTAELSSRAAQFSISREGHLAYVLGGPLPPVTLHLVIVSREGSSRRIPVDARSVFRPQTSRDGERIAFVSQARIWLYTPGRAFLERFSVDPKTSRAIWSPDGSSLTFDFGEAWKSTQIRSQPVQGGGGMKRLLEPDGWQIPGSWHPNGRYLAYLKWMPASSQAWGPRSHVDIWILDRERGSAAALLKAPYRETAPAFSPDGRWLAYASDETGRCEVMVTAFPTGGTAPIRSTSGGGMEPLWARNGRELYWRDGSGSVYAADVRYTPNPAFGAPRKLFESSWRFPTGTLTRSYDLSPDGKGFVMTEAETPLAPVTEIKIVANWLTELRRLVPSR